MKDEWFQVSRTWSVLCYCVFVVLCCVVLLLAGAFVVV